MTEQSVKKEELPDGSVRLSFDAPILWGTEPKKDFVIRRPTIGEQMRLRDPLTWVLDGQASMPIINGDIVESYCRILIVGHDWEFLSRETNMALGMAIEETILGFFRNARTS